MGYPETAEGFMIDDHAKWTDFRKGEFKLKKFEEDNIDVAVECCGVCSSDLHTINGGWGGAPLPLCVGHEIIGKAIKVGSKVKNIKVGDRVGVGAQVGADKTCNHCNVGQENYCYNMVDTYGAPWPIDGTMSQGGFSSHVRAQDIFTFKIPDNLPSELAAPMLCAGITVYSPLVRLGAGKGKKIGIVGLGGLGHFAVLFGHALGAEISVISHSDKKKDDAIKMGANEFIMTKDKDWQKPHLSKFDFIINTAPATHEFDLSTYLSTLKVGGTFHVCGIGGDPYPEIRTGTFMPGQYYIGASHLGNRPEMEAMLELASKINLKPWIETIDISEAGCGEAMKRLSDNDIKYRFTLTNYDKVFGKRA